MSLIGNIIWFIFGGFIGLGYILAGLLICLTIVGIPFGLQAIALGQATLMPFGKEVVHDKEGEGFLRMIFQVIWLVLFGWEIAMAHFFSGLVLTITIIGLPFAKQHFKLIPVALFPFSYRLR